MSGFVVALVINPLDVVATRLYNQPDKVGISNFYIFHPLIVSYDYVGTNVFKLQ